MRISADMFDEDLWCFGFESEPESKETKVRVVVKDSANEARTSINTIEDMFKEFQELSIHVSDSTDQPTCSERLKEPKTLMEHTDDSSRPPEDLAGPSNRPETSTAPSWYNKMKEELKKEVTDEVLKTIDDKLLKGTCEEEQKRCGETNETERGTDDVVHYGVFCDNCDKEITGIRYKCGNCEDFDLCAKCENEDLQKMHDTSHIFLKIRIPSCLFALQQGASKKIYQVSLADYEVANAVVLNKAVVEASDVKKDEEKESMKAKFICDETIPDGTVVYPGMRFVKTWRVCNAGTKSWTKDTMFRLLWGCQELKSSSNEIMAPPLNSGEEGTVSISFTAPDAYGHYENYWEFHQFGKSFGDTFWCRIRVDPMKSLEGLPLSESNRNLALKALKFHHNQCLLKNKRRVKEDKKKRESRKKEVRQIVDVLTAVHEDQGCRRRRIGQRKPVISSQTATPNNTPFDLTPPKSPEPREFVDIKNEVTVSSADAVQPIEEKLNNVSVCTLETDDKASISTLSSSDSDSEFVVIPMPKCFSLLEPFTSQTSHLKCSKSDFSDMEQGGSHIIVMQEPEVAPVQGNTECVLQETSIPEEIDQVNLVTTIHVKEDLDKNLIISNVSLSCSPSSSSISIVDSDSNSPVTKTVVESIPVHVNSEKKGDSQPVGEVMPSNERQEECSVTSSITFPKFPLDVEPERPAAAVEDVTSKQEGERTIQVLPEGLVTGALLAAATVYNTARAVISNLQPSKNDEGEEHIIHPTAPPAQNTLQLSPAEQLYEMGFCNRVLNDQLLRENSGDVARVVAELVSLNDNDWYASRHNPNSPSSG